VDEEVAEVNLPSVDGCLGILPGHCPLLVAIGEGTLAYTSNSREGREFAIAGGYAEVLPEKVLVFTELRHQDN
jgi:F-type H+-transporting ATPase subunit epsilon